MLCKLLDFIFSLERGTYICVLLLLLIRYYILYVFRTFAIRCHNPTARLLLTVTPRHCIQFNGVDIWAQSDRRQCLALHFATPCLLLVLVSLIHNQSDILQRIVPRALLFGFDIALGQIDIVLMCTINTTKVHIKTRVLLVKETS